MNFHQSINLVLAGTSDWKCLRFLWVLFFSSSQLLYAQKSVKVSEKMPLFFEKVYLHTDRELFLPGEDIWYRAYLVDAQSNMPLASSKTLYVELISQQMGIVQRETIYLENSMGSGDFKLSDSIAPGTYILRAYTNWMRNFGDTFVFKKNIRIAGPGPSATSTSAPASVRPLVINFFPEGGSMLEEVSGRVAFKLERNDGAALACRGVIISSKGDTAAVFAGDSLGLGSFLLKPLPGLDYTAFILTARSEAVKVVLPRALAKGFSLFVQEKDSFFNVLAFSNALTFAEYQGQKLQLRIKNAGRLYMSTDLPVDSDKLNMSIPKSSLRDGISVLTLYDSKGRPHAERLIFLKRMNSPGVATIADKSYYSKGDLVTLKLNVKDPNGQASSAHVSVAVTDESLVPFKPGDIESYLLLESELGGEVAKAKMFMKEATKLELLLLTQGWRDYIWRQTEDSAYRISKLLERGLSLGGEVKDRKGKMPLVGANVSLRLPRAEGTRFFSTRTDSLGRFYLDDLLFYGTQPAIINSINNKGEPLGKISLETAIRETLPVGRIFKARFDRPAASSSYAEKLLQQHQRYKLSDTIRLRDVQVKAQKKSIVLLNGDLLVDFGYPEEDFKVTAKDHDYRNLLHFLLTKSMYAVPGRGVGIRADRLLFRGDGNAPVEPLIIVNGQTLNGTSDIEASATDEEAVEDASVPASDEVRYNDFFATLTMDMVEELNVRKMVRNSGKIGFVLTIKTKPGALDVKYKDKIVTTISGYYESRKFYTSPYPAGKLSQEIKPTIYWNPQVLVNIQGEAVIQFQASSSFRVDVQGFTAKGVILNKEDTFPVR